VVFKELKKTPSGCGHVYISAEGLSQL